MAKFLRGLGNANRGRTPGGIEDGPELIFVVMGSTGTGKSSLINALTHTKSANVSDSLGSETSDIKVTPWIFDRKRIKLVDTPGFDDTNLSDTAVLKKIADFLQASFGRQVFVNGIIYLHRIIDPRMTGTAVKNLNLLQDLCGNEMKNVLLVTTFWDLCPKVIGEKRESELRSTYWRPLLELGSRMHRYKHKSSGHELMQDILGNQSSIIELQLQIQLTQSERTLLETTAGGRLQEGLNHQLEQLEMTLNQVQGERDVHVARRSAPNRNGTDRVNAQESRIMDEIATIKKDLEVLQTPRYIAMEEIDNKVAEIVAGTTGLGSLKAFWKLYGAVEDEITRGIDSPTEGIDTSPGYQPRGFGDQQFGRKNTAKYKELKPPREDLRSYDSPRDDTRGIIAGFDNLQVSEYSPVGYGGQQDDRGYQPQEYDEPEVGGGGHFDQYSNQYTGGERNPNAYGQPQYDDTNDFDEYGNQRQNTSGYQNQHRRGSRGY